VSIHKLIFYWVAEGLLTLAQFLRISYYEINILVYYFLIPFTWAALLDGIFDVHYLKITFVFICIALATAVRDFRKFSEALFKKSVAFLNYFNRFKSNYIASSVWICVVLPGLIYAALIYQFLH
jgi:hypothetical protein